MATPLRSDCDVKVFWRLIVPSCIALLGLLSHIAKFSIKYTSGVLDILKIQSDDIQRQEQLCFQFQLNDVHHTANHLPQDLCSVPMMWLSC